jgi:hypothetical protein
MLPVEHHQFSQKFHNRIVFKEVGMPIYKVISLKDAFHVLIDALGGIASMDLTMIQVFKFCISTITSTMTLVLAMSSYVMGMAS